MQFSRVSIITLSLLLPAGSLVSAWGDVGHRTVAYVAQKYLTPAASQMVDSILGTDNGFEYSDAATWPDTIKRQRPETAGWHFVDARDSPPHSCGVHYPADCSAQGKNGCIITAINEQTNAFLSPSTDDNTRREALMFLMHFLGDVHQPLHVEEAYRGGNEIPVCFGHKCSKNNLHSVWDTEIPHKICGLKSGPKHDEEKEAASSWADKLTNVIEQMGISVGSECADIDNPESCSLAWAQESNAYVCKYVMKESLDWIENTDLSQDYFEGAVDIVEELIAKAGVRLAAWLNALADRAGQSKIVFSAPNQIVFGQTDL